MSSAASSLHPGLPLSPVDLSVAQRAGLVAVVVAVHAAVALGVWRAAPTRVRPAEQPVMEVSLISQAAPTQPVPALSPEPLQPPALPAVPLPAPALARPTTQPALPTPATLSPPLLASAKPAQAQDMQAPTPPEVKPAPPAAAPAPPPPASVPNTAQATSAAEAGRAPAQPRVLPSSAVRYLVKPTLVYPRVSRELGESGVVQLKLLIDEFGHPLEITVARSSGFSRLDQQAVQAMKSAHFQPYIEDGVARKVSVLAPLTFNLEEQ